MAALLPLGAVGTIPRMAVTRPRATSRARGQVHAFDSRRRLTLVGFVVASVMGAGLLGASVFADSQVALAADEEIVPAVARLDANLASGELAVAASEPVPTATLQRSVPGDEQDPETLAELDALVAALAEDRTLRNASRAIDRFGKLLPIGTAHLERALDSHDQQQRHFAAYLLRWRTESHSPRLCEVTVEALRRDRLPGYYRTLLHRPAVDALRWLANDPVPALLPLRRALYSQDEQQQFYTAFLLAICADIKAPSFTCRVLIDHLGDNEIGGDALMAANSLYRMGPLALPEIRLARRWADDQAIRMLDLIERNLVDDDNGIVRTLDAQHARRQQLRTDTVTTVYVDPCREFDLYRSPIPQL